MDLRQKYDFLHFPVILTCGALPPSCLPSSVVLCATVVLLLQVVCMYRLHQDFVLLYKYLF